MKKFRKVFLIIALVVLFIVVTLILLYRSFISPVSTVKKEQEIEIKSGMTSAQIGTLLESKKLIKNAKFFRVYLKINSVYDLKAGTYLLSPDMPLKKIVSIIREGNNYSNSEIQITFKEGINFRNIATIIAENTDNSYDDVLNTLKDEEYLNSLIEDYWFITEDIKNSEIYYALEGYLFPDTYKFRSKSVTVHEIFKTLLDQMGLVLEPYKELIETNNLNVHEILTLASMAEKEVNKESDRAKVVSVFKNRIAKGMSLGSDVTARYGIKLDDTRALTKSELNDNNPYNTRLITKLGLPVGPISTVSKSSIEASIRPDNTNYLYFISNIQTDETFFFEKSQDFEKKKAELSSVNAGY